jgi:molybdopterin-guanine dinucleotide biosynthesis protein A
LNPLFKKSKEFSGTIKSCLAAIDKAITAGNYRIIDPLKNCSVNCIDLDYNRQFENLNTMKDYH